MGPRQDRRPCGRRTRGEGEGSRPLRRAADLLLIVLGLASVGWLLLPLLLPDEASLQRSGPGAREDGGLLGAEGARSGQDAPAPTLGATARPEQPEDAAALEPWMRPVTLRGRVVDAESRPVAGARVTAVGAAALDAETTTDAGGRYGLRWASVLRGTTILVIATAPDGRVGQETVWIWPSVTGPWDVRRIVLGEPQSLRVRVEREGTPVSDAVVRVGFLLEGQQYNDLGLIAIARTGPDGEARVAGLVAGTWLVDALDAVGRRARARAHLPAADGAPLVLALEDDHPITVRVVEKGTDAPVPGVVLQLQERVETSGQVGFSPSKFAAFRPPTGVPATDAEGRVVLRGLAAVGDLLVLARVPGWSVASRQIHLAEAPPETVLRLEHMEGRRWRLEPGDVPVPADGTRVGLRALDVERRAQGGTLEAVIEAGELVVAAGRHGVEGYLATTPDGAVALAIPGEETTSFHRPRAVTVRVASPAGIPLPGVLVTLRTHGAYPYAGVSDGGGWLRFDGLPPENWEVLSVNSLLPSYHADATEGDAHVDIVFGAERRLEVEVLVGDRPGFPPGFSLETDDYVLERRDDPARGLVTLRTFARPRDGDDEGDEVREPTLGPQAGLRVEAPEHVADPVQVQDAGGVVRCRVVFRRAWPLVLRDHHRMAGARDPLLQRWNAERGRWQTLSVEFDRWVDHPNEGGVRVVFAAVVAGRYRAVDPEFGLVTDPIEVRDDAPPPEMSFPTGTAGLVQVVLHLPEGYGRTDVEILRSFSDPEDDGRWLRELGTGRTSVPVPGDRPMVLRLHSQVLRPHPTLGTTTVRRAGGEVHLTMITGPQVWFRFPDILDEDSFELWARAEGSDAFVTPRVRPVRNGYAALLQAPGTYELWVRVEPSAPVSLGRRVVGEGVLDVGLVDPPDGARLVVELGPDGADCTVYAVHLGAPPYRIEADVDAKGHAELEGLGPGRFRVEIETWEGPVRPAGWGSDEARQVEVGEGGTVTLDLR